MPILSFLSSLFLNPWCKHKVDLNSLYLEQALNIIQVT